MEAYVSEAIKRYSLLDSGERNITVALSGGADSMALLNALMSLRESFGFNINAAHLNHMIRGAEAERDEEFVKEQCKALGVTVFTERADIPAIAERQGISTELAARRVRYEFLERVSAGLIATAHTASDNLETVLFNMTRGTALNGLCGIPPKRGRIIRPLLLCTRAQIEEYCEKNSIPYVTDSTNLSDNYTRNKIRHNAVPVLKTVNPSLENAVMRMCDAVREDCRTLDKAAEDYIESNTEPSGALLLENFAALGSAVAKRVIIKYIEKNAPGIMLENVHIESAYNAAVNGGRTSLPEKKYALSARKRFTVEKTYENVYNTEYKVSLKEYDGIFSGKDKKVNNLFLNNSFDCDKIIGKLVVRTRNAGDSIRLASRGCTKTLNRLFSEKRIPVSLRDRLPVIADDVGVIWVYGFGVAKRCAVTDATEKVKIIEVKENNGK